MRVNAVDGSYVTAQNNNSKINFKSLIKDKSALPIINSMSESDILEFKKIEERLSKTKFWDLKISSIGNQFKEFKFHFIDKKHEHGVISDGIYPYHKKGKTINVYSIIYGPENTSHNLVESLKFKSKKRADEIYEIYHKNIEMVINRQFNLTPIESLKSKEIELNMLEEAASTPIKEQNLTHIYTELGTKNTIGNYVPEE